MDVKKVQRGELVAIAGGLLLALAVFMKWYAADGPNVTIAGHGAGTYSAWQVHHLLRFLLLLAASAPLVLAWIVARDHALSWPRGEVTAQVAAEFDQIIVAKRLDRLVLAIDLPQHLLHVLDRPGDPSSLIHLRIGWFLALAGAAAMLAGSMMRQQESGPRRKPPGTM